MRKELRGLILKAGAAFVAFVILTGLIFGFDRQCGDSMSPAVKDGDLVFFYRLQKEYNRSDLVVLEKEGDVQLRRIIAGPGDRVDISENGLEINGYLQQEDDIYTDTMRFAEGIDFPVTVGQEEYFVLGDNRENARDSRIYGLVNQKEIKGTVISLLRRRGL